MRKESRFKFVKLKDIFACVIFLFFIPIALFMKIFLRDYWLVGEEKNEARDNGYHFFKYVRLNHPKQKIIYVINKKCPDYRKVEGIGKVINWGGISHWFWYMTAKKNISSQKGCKPNPAACYLFEIKLRLWKNKRYFLQHGITINNPGWLYNDVCRFKLFACGAAPEYDYIKSNFGYPDDVVKHLGFCRFDSLHEKVQQKNQILFMPTWRSWLVRERHGISLSELRQGFKSTLFYKNWVELMSNKKLNEYLEENNLTVLFYPHRNMQIFLDEFNKDMFSDNIVIADVKSYDIQSALKDSKLLVTDYSSVFFDFSYMKKPVVFFQFDEKEFREKQYLEGYFDYRNNPLGVWSDNTETAVSLILEKADDDFKEVDRITEFFTIYDDKNCERTYKEIKAV